MKTEEEAITLASVLPLADGIAALNRWKAERTVAWWEQFDHAVQTVTAEAVRLWPVGDVTGLLRVVQLSKAVMAETAGTMGIPDSMLPFIPDPAKPAGEAGSSESPR